MDKKQQQYFAKRRLFKAKALAMSLLIFAAILFVLASLMLPYGVHWSFIKAFAEAAMVGAVADWFAVVALFRKPLGLPIPHTAIIPANQNKIAEQLGYFIENNFLQASAIANKLIQLAPSRKLCDWLENAEKQRKVSQLIAQQLPVLLSVIQSEQMAKFVTNLVQKQYSGKSLGTTLAKMLGFLDSTGYQQVFLNNILLQIREWLAHEETRNALENSINNWAAKVEKESPSRWDKLVSLFKGSAMDMVDGWLAKKVLDWADGYIIEVLEDSNHSMRLNVNQQMKKLMRQLQYSPAWHKKLNEFKSELSQSTEIENIIANLWQSLLHWSQEDCKQEDSVIQLQIIKVLQQVLLRIQQNPTTLHELDVKMAILIKDWVNEYKHHVNVFVTDKVKAWNSKELVDKLELSVGKDLQYIRINGTIVGGLVGLGIHTVSYYFF